MELTCRHNRCSVPQYNNIRHPFKTKGGRNKHEKKCAPHFCPDVAQCLACQEYGLEQQLAPIYERPYGCRHINCQKTYHTARDLWRHEMRDEHDRSQCATGETRCGPCEKLDKKSLAPEWLVDTVNHLKRKLDESDPDVYMDLPLAKKQRLLSSADQAVVLTSLNGKTLVFDLKKNELENIRDSDNEPTIDTLLALKDDLCVPDSKWASVVQTFHLSHKCSIYYIRKRRNALDNYIPISKTNGNGRQQELEKVLKYLFEKENVDPNVPLRIKFAFDGARVTIKQKQMQVVGTVELLSNKTVEEIKSSTNAHQWIIYLGDETNEDLKKELSDALPTLRSIFKDESVSNSVKIKIRSDTYPPVD